MSKKARRAITTLLTLMVFVGTVFSASLTYTSTGDAKLYDNSYKATTESEIKEGYVIRTFFDSLSLFSDQISLDFGPGALARIEKLDSAIEVYILDGYVIASSDTNSFTIKTPVSVYNSEAGTTIVVTTTKASESATVTEGFAQFKDTLTNKKAELVPQEPEVEEATEETVAQQKVLLWAMDYAGVEAAIEAYRGKAFIHYPAFVTDSEINAFLESAKAKYPELLSTMFFTVVEPGLVTATYSTELGEEEFEALMAILDSDIPSYIDSVLEPVRVTVPVLEKTVPQTNQSFTANFNYFGIDITLDAYTGKAYITYPDFVTREEVITAAMAANAKYAELLSEVRYSFEEDGKVVLTYPQSYGQNEFNTAVALIKAELPQYIASLIGKPEVSEPEAVVTEVTEVATATEEVEEVAEPEPEVIKTALETVSKEEAAKKVKEDNAFKFGAEIGLSYGASYGPYMGIDALSDRVGFYNKGAVVTVDPYIKGKKLEAGLHIQVKVFDLANSFSFNFNGLTNAVNTVFGYVSKLNYNSGAFSLNIDRKSDLEFTSPIGTTLDRAFSNNSALVAQARLGGKNFAITAFADDLQFENKLSGKNQFMGLKAGFNFKGFELDASAVADTRLGLRNAELYPAAQAKISVSKVSVTASAAAKMSINSITTIQGLLFEARANADFGLLNVGLGASYSTGSYFNGLMNNGPTTVTSAFEGKTLGAYLSAGLKTQHITISAEAEVPFSLSGGSRLAYNTVRTEDGKTLSISADTFTFKAKAQFGILSIEGGAAYDGLCGRLATAAKALIARSGRRAALSGLLDPQIATYYAQVKVDTKYFDVSARADFDRVNGSLTLPLSVALTIKF